MNHFLSNTSLVEELLSRQAERQPEATVAVHLDDRLTYRELDDRASRFAGVLRAHGIRPGDRVSLVLENGPAYLTAYFGVLKAGAVVVGLNPANTPRGLSFVLNDCAVSAVVGHRKHLRLFSETLPGIASVSQLFVSDAPGIGADDIPGASTRHLEGLLEQADPFSGSADRRGDDLAGIIYTSGTTGRPKGVMLSHRNLLANTDSIVQYLELDAGDSVMVVLPFYYSYGQSLFLTHVAVGGRLVIDNRFAYPNKVLEIMERERVTGFSGVPSTFAILVHKSALDRFDLSALRYLTQAGGPMAPPLALELRRLLPHVDIFIMYGQTEAAARLSYLPPERLDDKLGSIGIAIPGVELRVLDAGGRPVGIGEVGEIVASGDNVMTGYWGSPEESAAVLRPEGLYTGDLARVDEEGFLYIVSRKSDMIKSGAHRISPKEIEEILAEFEKVYESAVIGVEDPILGEAIVAFVVPQDRSDLTEKEVLLHCKQNLPPFKLPKEVHFRNDLPKTASGKVKRARLREEYLAAAAEEGGNPPRKEPARS